MIAALALALASSPAQGLPALAERVRSRVLANGVRVIVLPMGQAPVAAFHVYVGVGSADEEAGLSGLSHFAEHMAFKGSRRIGALDWPAEARALRDCDEAWAAWEQARREPGGVVGAAELVRLQQVFERARADADALSDAGAFDRAVETAGGLDQNATTGMDSTRYFVSLPSNRLEHWFWLAHEQLGDPVMREFYQERRVIFEERSMRLEASPLGAVLDQLQAACFRVHPYGRATIGRSADLEFLDRPEMRRFWRLNYTGGRIVVAVVGRVDAQQVLDLADRYLGRLAPGEVQRPQRPTEPAQESERSLVLHREAEPLVVAAWRTEAPRGRAGLAQEALVALLAGHPNARVRQRLVRELGWATRIDLYPGYPGVMDPSLLLAVMEPAAGAVPEQLVATLQQELELLAAEGPSATEMQAVRRGLRMDRLRDWSHLDELAADLAEAEAEEGGWGALFQTYENCAALTAAEVQAAAAALTAQVRTSAFLLPPGRSAHDPVLAGGAGGSP